MNQKYLFVVAGLISFLFVNCNSNQQKEPDKDAVAKFWKDTAVASGANASKGIGKFKDVKLTHPLDEAMIGKAQPIFDAKCFACHKLTDEKLVGPGWKGITDRRTPEWVMNFITNTSVMLDKDLAAQAEMVTCVVRMPEQNLTDDDARNILEFMRKNDGKK